MKYRKIFAAFLALTLLLGLSACGGGSNVSSEPTPAVQQETVAPEAAEAIPEDVTENTEDTAPSVGFVFSTDDRDGNPWDESCFSQADLTMINFWEPWCPPCVGEMPELESLYENYRDQGFQILGVYATAGQEEDVDAVLSQAGITYPILHYCPEFDDFQTGYVPTTVFLNSRGEIVGSTQIGSLDYASWAEIIEGLL